jgi:3-oxoacyl-[acyl-carrier protein] reductase
VLLKDKVAVIHGGGGAIGGAVARAFAYEGARVFLAGRTRASLERVAGEIANAGGRVQCAEVDALDEQAVDAHADAIAASAGAIDIALNAIGVMHVQGIPFTELSLHDFECPVNAYTRANFLTARAAARHMAKRRAGVILTLSTPGARLSGQGFLGNGVASGAVETFSRILAGELGGSGIRVVCLRPDAIPEAAATSHTGKVFARIAEKWATTVDAMLDERARTAPLLKRLPTLADVGHYATFVASDRAGAMTGIIANLSCGSLVD